MESVSLLPSPPPSYSSRSHRLLLRFPSASSVPVFQSRSPPLCARCLIRQSSSYGLPDGAPFGLSPPPAASMQLQRRRIAPVLASSAASPVPSPASDASASSPSISDIVWPAAGAFVAMLTMSYVDKLVEPMGLIFTIAPFGAVCAVLFAAPTTPAAKKYNMFVAHIGCAAMGIAALALFGPGWLARGTALAASIAFMQLTGSLHPPAAGLPLLFIDIPKFHQLQLWYLIFPSAVGCIFLCLLQEVVLLLRRSCRF